MGLGVKIFCSITEADGQKTIAIININGDITMNKDFILEVEDTPQNKPLIDLLCKQWEIEKSKKNKQ